MFLPGVVLYLLMKWNGNFWLTAGFHTGWNYAQVFLFGVPNSEEPDSLALISGSGGTQDFFFDRVCGYEGCICMTVLCILMIVVLLSRLYRKGTFCAEKKSASVQETDRSVSD